MKALLSFAIVLILGTFAHAVKPVEDPACQAIAKQCEAAGYMPGAHKKNGKGLWADCVGAIAHGKSVAGVTATADEAKACASKAKEDHHENKEKREEKKEQKK